jgi:prostaglandin reductase 3
MQGISGSVALEQVEEVKSGETVLVTAAAGGTSQCVVQLAKLAGDHVIGTTSSDEKAEVLKALGCDRVVNYNKEDIGTVLETEYPNGVDLVFEPVGGETFKAAVQNIAVHGRVIGFTSGYLEGH